MAMILSSLVIAALPLATTLEMPIGWILSTIVGLGGVIATLAGIIYKILTDRLDAQDRLIEHLKTDVERLRKGCGQPECHWRESQRA